LHFYKQSAQYFSKMQKEHRKCEAHRWWRKHRLRCRLSLTKYHLFGI
jgi:hypothetical protein